MVTGTSAVEDMVEDSMIDSKFWRGKRVFLTGHTGFKGGWLAIWLSSMGAIVKGYALSPTTNPSLFVIAGLSKFVESDINDIREFEKLAASMRAFSPEIIFHMAAQPLVRASYKKPLETYEINVMGTANLLEAARYCPSVRTIVNVTTDKCYENNELVWGYRETDPMGGKDPYSSSKGCAELVTAAYRESFLKDSSIGVATARAGNVIGGGDWAADRLIPDILKAFDSNIPVIVRNPKSTRPWQHVLEPLSGYIILAQQLYDDPTEFSGGWNFGPYEYDVKPVDWILNHMTELWGDASWQLDLADNVHEAKLLKLDISKASAILNWSPTWSLAATLGKIINWHKSWLLEADMHAACLDEISEFTKDMKRGNS